MPLSFANPALLFGALAKNERDEFLRAGEGTGDTLAATARSGIKVADNRHVAHPGRHYWRFQRQA